MGTGGWAESSGSVFILYIFSKMIFRTPIGNYILLRIFFWPLYHQWTHWNILACCFTFYFSIYPLLPSQSVATWVLPWYNTTLLWLWLCTWACTRGLTFQPDIMPLRKFLVHNIFPSLRVFFLGLVPVRDAGLKTFLNPRYDKAPKFLILIKSDFSIYYWYFYFLKRFHNVLLVQVPVNLNSTLYSTYI